MVLLCGSPIGFIFKRYVFCNARSVPTSIELLGWMSMFFDGLRHQCLFGLLMTKRTVARRVPFSLTVQLTISPLVPVSSLYASVNVESIRTKSLNSKLPLASVRVTANTLLRFSKESNRYFRTCSLGKYSGLVIVIAPFLS